MATNHFNGFYLSESQNFSNKPTTTQGIQLNAAEQQQQQQHQQQIKYACNTYYAVSSNNEIQVNYNNDQNKNTHSISANEAVMRYHQNLQQQQQQQMNTDFLSNSNNILNYQNTNDIVNAGQHHQQLGKAIKSAAEVSTHCNYSQLNGNFSCYNRHRFMPYNHNRTCNAEVAAMQSLSTVQHAMPACPTNHSQQLQQQQRRQLQSICHQPYQQNTNGDFLASTLAKPHMSAAISLGDTPIETPLKSKHSRPELTALLPTCSQNKPALSYAGAVLNYNGDQNSGDVKIQEAKSTGNHANNTSNIEEKQPKDHVTLQITNLDYLLGEEYLMRFLMYQMRPITPVLKLSLESNAGAKVTVPNLYFAKQVVTNLHRKKIGMKRILVSYTRDSSLAELNTLRCQTAGLLQDVPLHTLPLYKFRELFQARFKTSINVLDLQKMQDIIVLKMENNEEKFITLQPDLVNTLDASPLMEGLQHSKPYCTIHLKQKEDKGWAELEIDPLPNVFLSLSELQKIIHSLMKQHSDDIPIASLAHCIEGELNIRLKPNDNGVNLEHLISCIPDVKLSCNDYGIKILTWQNSEPNQLKDHEQINYNAKNTNGERSFYSKCINTDSMGQISREVIELLKMCPKAAMKFSRFIPAYHNHFGKQCRVADYGYTKLVELFEALSSIVQVMGDGEDRQITLTHRTQMRRFTADLLRLLRGQNNKPVLLSQLPNVFAKTQHRKFDITDYGVCDISDILDGLINSNVVVVSKAAGDGNDLLISIPKRRQNINELEKTSIFACEMVELFSNAPQYTIPLEKFVRSYHYHFSYQCRLSDYGCVKLTDLMESIKGIVEMNCRNEEDRKIFLSVKLAQRVFAEQCETLVQVSTGSPTSCAKWVDVLDWHKNKYGYQIQAQTLGVKNLNEVLSHLPFMEVLRKEDAIWIVCHNTDTKFRMLCFKACKFILVYKAQLSVSNATEKTLKLTDFIQDFGASTQENITEEVVKAMNQIVEIFTEDGVDYLRVSKYARFLICLVKTLEQRRTLMLDELRRAVECDLRTTFQYGYPNLLAIIAANPDLFVYVINSTDDCTAISLAPNCELRNCPAVSVRNNFRHIPLGKPFVRQNLKSNSNFNGNRRMPFSEVNGRYSSMQGYGIGTGNGNGNGNGNGPPNKLHSNVNENSAQQQYYQQKQEQHHQNHYQQLQQNPPSNQQQNHNFCNNENAQMHQFYKQQEKFGNISERSAFLSMNNMKNSYSSYNNNTNNANHNSNNNSESYHNSSLSFDAAHFNPLQISMKTLNTTNNSMNMSMSSDISLNISENVLNSSMHAIQKSFVNTEILMENENRSVPFPPPLNLPPPPSSTPMLQSQPPFLTMNMQPAMLQQQQQFDHLLQLHMQQIQEQQHLELQQRQLFASSKVLVENNMPLMLLSMPPMDASSLQPTFPPSLYGEQKLVPNAITSAIQSDAHPKIEQNANKISQNVNEMNNLAVDKNCGQPPGFAPLNKPRKLETPTNNNASSWLESVWDHDNSNLQQLKGNQLLNIPLPKMETVLSALLSPYTISKTSNLKQHKVFNYEHFDRKMA